MIFKKHGDYRVTFDGRIVLVEATGPWNEETALSYVDEIKTLQVKIKGAFSGLIYALQGEKLGTPEAKNTLQSLQQWRVNEGYVCPTAIVFLDEGQRSLYEALFIDMYKDNPIKPRFFPSIEHARQWLMKVESNN